MRLSGTPAYCKSEAYGRTRAVGAGGCRVDGTDRSGATYLGALGWAKCAVWRRAVCNYLTMGCSIKAVGITFHPHPRRLHDRCPPSSFLFPSLIPLGHVHCLPFRPLDWSDLQSPSLRYQFGQIMSHQGQNQRLPGRLWQCHRLLSH